MKKLSVVVAGTGQIRDVEIQPGTRAGDILHQLNLPDYLLSKGPNEPFFAAAESVFLYLPSDEIRRHSQPRFQPLISSQYDLYCQCVSDFEVM